MARFYRGTKFLMISTTLKTQNNYIPSSISNIFLDLYAEMSTQQNGSLCNANFQTVYTFGGLATVAYTVNNARPTFLTGPSRVTNSSQQNSSLGIASMPSLGVISFYNSSAPFGNQYDFTIFAVLNVNSTSHPGGAFMTDGNYSFWLCGGTSQPLLTSASAVLLTDTFTTGLKVVMIQRNGNNLSIRVNNNTLQTLLQPNTFISNVYLGVGRYNNISYATTPTSFRRLIGYRKAISTDEIIKVRNYLNKLYGTLAYA